MKIYVLAESIMKKKQKQVYPARTEVFASQKDAEARLAEIQKEWMECCFDEDISCMTRIRETKAGKELQISTENTVHLWTCRMKPIK